jgi:CheY-like chemotaxis protein
MRTDRATVLVEAGYAVRVADGASIAMALVAREVPGLILLDWWMPVITGEQFLDWLSRDARFRGVHVIITTGDADGVENPHASAILHKPHSVETLLQLIQRHVPNVATGAAAASVRAQDR